MDNSVLVGLLFKNTRHLVDVVIPDNPHIRFMAMGRVIVVVLELPPDIDQFRLVNLIKPIIRPLLISNSYPMNIIIRREIIRIHVKSCNFFICDFPCII